MAKYLSIEDIVAATDTKVVEVEVKEWGGVVRVKELNGKERDEFEAELAKRSKGNSDFRGVKKLLLKMALVDEQNNPLFDEKSVAALDVKSGNVIGSLFETACQLNGIGEKGEEEAEKN